MNIVLFEAEEIGRVLPLGDERAEHVLRVLRRRVGDSFDVGVFDGPKGKATLEAIREDGLELSFEWSGEEPSLLPIDLIVGLSRPQTNRKILNEATTLGVRSIRFAVTDRGEPSYAESRLWTTGEWRRHVVAGVAQAFATRLPTVSWGMSLEEAVNGASDVGRGAREGGAEGRLDDVDVTKVALDNYEATQRLGKAVAGCRALVLAIGSERGWTGKERDLLRVNGFVLAGLGERVLRTETAVVAAVSVAREVMGR